MCESLLQLSSFSFEARRVILLIRTSPVLYLNLYVLDLQERKYMKFSVPESIAIGVDFVSRVSASIQIKNIIEFH